MSVARKDDPAIRLQSILRDLHGVAQEGISVGNAIHQTVGAGSAARSVGIMFGLFNDIDSGLRALEGTLSVDAYLSNIVPIGEWLASLDLRQQWSVQPKMDERTISILLICSDQLRTTRPLVAITDEAVTTLCKQVEEMLRDVLEAEVLEVSLRQFLTRHLQRIRSALEEYRLTGSYRLSEEVRSAVGDFATERPTINTEAEHSLWKRFVEFSKNVIVVTTAVVQLSSAPANIAQAYTALDQDRPAQVSSKESPALSPAHPIPELGPGPSNIRTEGVDP